MITENLSTLKINKLTRTQYEAALEAGKINENELYMIPEEDADALATIGYVDEAIANNGGKINSISVNGVAQTIDENKNIDITVPETDLSDYSTTEQMNTAITAAIGNAIAASY